MIICVARLTQSTKFFEKTLLKRVFNKKIVGNTNYSKSILLTYLIVHRFGHGFKTVLVAM